jgi:hypothetical protein
MPLTKDFKETVRARLIRSSGFRKAVLQEAIDRLLAGDVVIGHPAGDHNPRIGAIRSYDG